METRTATVVLVVDQGRVLLARKMDKVGQGKWNGYGGGQEPEDHGRLRRTAIRELEEETGGVTGNEDDLLPRARVQFFYFGNDTDIPNHDVCFYVLEKFVGEPISTVEMENPTWFPLDSVPYDELLPGDQLFFPLVLNGRCVAGKVWFKNKFEGVARHKFLDVDESSLES